MRDPLLASLLVLMMAVAQVFLHLVAILLASL